MYVFEIRVEDTNNPNTSDPNVEYESGDDPEAAAAAAAVKDWRSGGVADSLLNVIPISRGSLMDRGRRALVAVTVGMRSGLQFQQHFESSETLETVAKWGLSSHAIADDDSEEFFILQPAVRFTPSNLKRTLSELRLPRSVVLSVVKKTKRSTAAFAAAALEQSLGDDKLKRSDARIYMPPGAPV